MEERGGGEGGGNSQGDGRSWEQSSFHGRGEELSGSFLIRVPQFGKNMVFSVVRISVEYEG